jgi:predicted anti-sigma-YlaC factor YlaD
MSPPIWRLAILAGYVAFAVLVGAVYGRRGLAILLFMYFSASAWLAFVLVWNWASRAAGHWHFREI